MSRGIIISLCDLTGKFVEPWVAAGYDAVLVDPQHPAGVTVETHDSGATVTRIGCVIIDAMDHLAPIIRSGRVVYVAGWPPCTDVSLSGTRWWEAKRKADPYFQAKAAIVAEQCRMIGMACGCPWHFENPKSAFSRIFGKPQHKFQPWHFTGHCANDNYLKETWLWTGGGYVMPKPFRDDTVGDPDDRIHKEPPGDDRANFRSATPMGFSIAVFEANAPHLRGADNDNTASREAVA